MQQEPNVQEKEGHRRQMPSRERARPKSAKHVSKDMILEKSPYIWGNLMMSSESETKHSVKLFGIPRPQSCEQI